jgi:hypothetical protein
MTRILTRWSIEIRDKDILYKVNNAIFAKFILMQMRTYKILATISKGAGSFPISIYSQMQRNIDQLISSLRVLKEYDMENEAKELWKLMNQISAADDLRSYFHHKNKPNRWDFRYTSEQILEFAKDLVIQARHHNYIDDAVYDARISSL